MNNTAALRERLRDITGTFRVSDFPGIKAAHAIITKMVLDEEAVIVSNTKPKVYKVGKLKTHAAKAAPKAIHARRVKEAPAPRCVELWPVRPRASKFNSTKQ